MGLRRHTSPRYGSIHLAAFVSVLCAAVPCRADDEKDAGRLHDKGIELYKNGKFEEAIELFRAADALAFSPANTFNIAMSLEKLQRYEEAIAGYEKYLAMEGAVEKARAEEHLQALKKIPAVLDLQSEPPGAVLFLDAAEQPAGKTPLKLDVDPGGHTVTMKMNGFVPAEAEVTAVRGKTTGISLKLKKKVKGKARGAPLPRFRISAGGGYTLTNSDIILSFTGLTLDAGARLKSFYLGFGLEFFISRNSNVFIVYPLASYHLSVVRGFAIDFGLGLGAMFLTVGEPGLVIPQGRYTDVAFHVRVTLLYSVKFVFFFIRPVLIDIPFGAGNIKGAPMIQYLPSAGIGFQF